MSERFELVTIDYLIIVAYAVGILGIGFWVGRKKKSAESYLLAGRKSIWPLVGFGLMAANLSGTSYVGLAGAGYEDGISVWNYEWMATLVLTFFALFILPFYLRSKVDTMPQFLEKRYNRKSRYVFSAFTVFTALFIDSAGALFAGATVLKVLFPQLSLGVLVVIIALLGGLYVLLGGLSAVLITDTLQGILLLVAGGILFFLGLRELGSWEAVRQAAPPGGFTVIKPPDDDFMPWPGILTGVLWLGFYYWTTNQVVVQKVLSARTLDHGRWGALFCAFLQLPYLFLLVLPGTIGRALYPDLESPDMVWPTMAFDFLPVGLRGLVLAALVAALMSTLDSVLNGASSLVTNDFIRNLKPDLEDKKLLRLARVLVVVSMAIAALWAPQISRFPTIVEYFQSFLGHITMPVVVVFLGGLFWRRASRKAGFLTLVVGIPVGLAGFIANELLELFELQFLYATGVMLALSAGLFVVSSLSTHAPEPQEVEELTWSRDTWRAESEELKGKPWWKNYRIHSLLLVIVTTVLVVLFI